MAAAQLDELKHLGGQLDDAAFVCGGSVRPNPLGDQADVTVWYKSPEGQLNNIAFPPQDPTDLEKLVHACVPATFGRGDQDVLDPTYRQAVRLEPGQFATTFNLAEFPILAEVQRVIGGDLAGVRATLHKLNVYSSGGFFKAHRDTPRTSQCIGTIVVCLPTTFSGGEFVIKSADGSFSHTFEWGASMSRDKVQWCAFYSDCEHEVLPVRSGHRVTLTYVLEHVPLVHSTFVDAQSFTALGDRLAACLKDPAFAPDGTKLGFGLRHQYIVSNLAASDDDDSLSDEGNDYGGGDDDDDNDDERTAKAAKKTDGSRNRDAKKEKTSAVSFLKGADRVLMETLDRLGLQYVFAPVYASDVYRMELFGKECVPDYPKPYQEEQGYGSTYDGEEVQPPAEWQFPFPTEGDPQGEWRGDEERELFVSDWTNLISAKDTGDYGPYGYNGLDFHQLKLHRACEFVWIVRPTNFPYSKTSITYGNDHILGHYYAAGCLLVYVPPASKRGVKLNDA